MNRSAEAGQFLRDIVYGVNDALVTNVGIIAGFSVSLGQRRTVILAAIIDLTISAFSMGSGTYLSRTSELAFLTRRMGNKKEAEVAEAEGSPVLAAIIMWAVYFTTGTIPLIPFFIIEKANAAVPISLSLSIATFIALGAFKARVTDRKYLDGILQFFAFGTISAAIGFILGSFAERAIH